MAETWASRSERVIVKQLALQFVCPCGGAKKGCPSPPTPVVGYLLQVGELDLDS